MFCLLQIEQEKGDNLSPIESTRQSPIGAETSEVDIEAHDETWEAWEETEDDKYVETKEPDEPDFFADMQPVIQSCNATVVVEPQLSNKFASQQDWNDVDDEAWS